MSLETVYFYITTVQVILRSDAQKFVIVASVTIWRQHRGKHLMNNYQCHVNANTMFILSELFASISVHVTHQVVKIIKSQQLTTGQAVKMLAEMLCP